MHGGQPVRLHGADHLGLIGLGNGVDAVEAIPQAGEDGIAEAQHLLADAQGAVLCVQIVHSVTSSGNCTPLRRMMSRMG